MCKCHNLFPFSSSTCAKAKKQPPARIHAHIGCGFPANGYRLSIHPDTLPPVVIRPALRFLCIFPNHCEYRRRLILAEWCVSAPLRLCGLFALEARLCYTEYRFNKSKFEAEVCIMNIGFWSCIILVIPFLIIGVLFAIFKEKAAKFVSGFNSFSKEEQALYDKAYISRDIRNQCFMWAIIMLAGALLSCFLTPYIAIPTYIIWLVLFFREVHFDNHKAFEKYLLK